jgi:putative SOS response-associated peptidase YedK
VCGRFVGYRDLEELRRFFPIDKTACAVTANFNVAPRQEVLAINTRNGENWLDRYHWGLVPFWARDRSIGNRLINARAETVAEKPSFRNAFRKRRCLILADGFYEWAGPQGRKQPFFITLPKERPFAFAGLWERWDNRGRTEPAYLSCTIITTAACPSLQEVHHRMPVVLSPEAYPLWLDPSMQDPQILLGHLKQWTWTDFTYRPVSPRVNTARNNSRDLIEGV